MFRKKQLPSITGSFNESISIKMLDFQLQTTPVPSFNSLARHLIKKSIMKNIHNFIHLSLFPGLFSAITLSSFPWNALGVHCWYTHTYTHLTSHTPFQRIWIDLWIVIWSNITYKISCFLLQWEQTKSPSQQRLLFATSKRDGGFISLLPDFRISHSQLHKGKHTQPYTLTKNCCIPTEQELLECEQSSQPPPQPPGWQASPAGRPLHQTLFGRQTEKPSGFVSLKSLGCLSPSIIWGLYLCLCKKSSFKANLLHSLFRREGEGEDPSLEIHAGLKSH